MRYILTISIVIASIFAFSKDREINLLIEICDNAIDDDGDGLIDLNDDDCECTVSEPESLIPNPSFEEQDCCPMSRSQLNCATGWIQASQPTTDYIHTCGFQGWEGIPPPTPFPDGDGIMGFRDGRVINNGPQPNWKEYAGACLLSPLKADVEYTFEFYLGFVNGVISPPTYITFFGTSNCDNLPFGEDEEFLGCPTNDVDGGWSYLNSKREGGVGWKLVSINITPDEDINAIAIGPPCRETSSQENLYYFFDNLVLAESKFFSKSIIGTGNPCLTDFVLSIIDNADATYQWYKDGIAVIGATNANLAIHLSEGSYEVMEFLDGECTISKKFDYKVPTEFVSLDELVCQDEIYQFGDHSLTLSGNYIDTFLTRDLCDSIVSLNLRVLGESVDSVKARIFEGDIFRLEDFVFSEVGDYDVKLQSVNGCDSLVYIDLSFYKVFIPNAFSPNEDGINDVFEIYIEDPDVNIQGISIFDRWGNRVYSRSSSAADNSLFWDGYLINEAPKSGVYIYYIEFLLEGKINKTVIGEVALLN